MILKMVRMDRNERKELLLEIGIRVDSKEDEALLLNFLGRLDESLLGEHAFHGVVCVRENRIVKGNGVWKRRCGWRGVHAECVVESVMGDVY